MKCLLLTNQLFGWTGSEIVIVELCEYLLDAGHRVTILCNQLDPDFVKPLEILGAEVVIQPEKIDLVEFEFCYCQHQMINLLISKTCHTKIRQFPYVCYAHLSPFQELEFPGPIIEDIIADRIVANSQETTRMLDTLGINERRVSLFANPAPKRYFDATHPVKNLGRVLVVSNHMPNDLLEALTIIGNTGIKVTRVGSEFGQSRVLPKMVFDHDAVISIGKTVQYALAAKRPVFCYDHFGGPGWLGSDNYKSAAEYNFSGRPERRKIGADAIANEIVAGFEEALRFTEKFDAVSAGFSLEHHMDDMLRAVSNASKDEARLKKLDRVLNSPKHTQAISRESTQSNILREEKFHSFHLSEIVDRQAAHLKMIKRRKKGLRRIFGR